MEAQMRSRSRRKSQEIPERVALPLDDDACVRLPTVLRVYPVGRTSWWRGVAAGRYPRPVKLSPRVDAWRAGDIRQLLARRREEAERERDRGVMA
jgi:prophage regulatory protein